MFNEPFTNMIETMVEENSSIGLLQAEADLPQVWDNKRASPHVPEARLLLTRPEAWRAHTIRHHFMTKVIITIVVGGKEVDLLLYCEESCSVVGTKYLPKV